MAQPLRRPIFIAGPGRSGTTLLRSVLSAHSRIGIAPETHFLKQLNDEPGDGMAAGPEGAAAVWNRYRQTRRFHDLGVRAEDCCRWMNETGDHSMRGIFAAMLLAYGDRVGKERLGEKTPSNVHFIARLLDWFPDARIMVLRRDPRAVVASQLRSVWVQRRLTPTSLRHGFLTDSRIHQVAHYAKDWEDIFQGVLPGWRHENRVRVVSYETLVTDPEGELRRICGFLEETFEYSMLGERQKETTLPAAPPKDEDWRQWREEHHERSRSPISRDSLDKWRSQLTPTEIALIEGRCERGMEDAGYVFETRGRRRRAGRLHCQWVLNGQRVERAVRSIGSWVLRLPRRLRARVTRTEPLG